MIILQGELDNRVTDGFSRGPQGFKMEGTMTIQNTSDRHLVVFPHFMNFFEL